MAATRCPVFCTAVSKKNLPAALRLARNVATIHPGEQLVVLLVDDLGGHRADQLDLVFMRPDDLPIHARIIHELAICLTPEDLAATLVPSLLHELLRRQGDRSVVYLDADTVILSPLDELDELARTSGIVLTPRLLSVVPDDNKEPTQRSLVGMGAFDPGCVGVAHGAETFLTWWQSALDALASVEGAKPASVQRFLDIAPTIFSVRVLSDPRYGIAYWNAHERALSKNRSDELLVGASVARTVHLKGFSIHNASLFSAEAPTSPRVLLSDYPALAALCASVKTEIDELEGDAFDASPFSVLGDGSHVDEKMRRLVRRARQGGGFGDEEVPDPYSSDTINDFYDWLATPEKNDPLVPLLPRYLHEVVADRLDLSWSFQRLGTVDAPRFREWVENHGLDEEDLPAGLRRAIEKSAWWTSPLGVVSVPPSELKDGVTFAGYLGSSIGVGEAGRLVLEAMSRVGITATPLSTDSAAAAKKTGSQHVAIADRATNVVWVNADQLPGFASVVGPSFFDGRYTVGGWVWETEHLPKETADSALLVDEIWVPSDFVRQAVEPVVNRPVFTFPYPVTTPVHSLSFNRASHRIPQGFMFLFMFDFLSSAKRKNPLGLIDTYCRAFPSDDDGSVLVIKSVNGEHRLADLEAVRLAAAGRRDIVILNQRMDNASRGALLAACDCFVSLHRSEGFGLALAEAMLLAKPVVATGYSGNLEFMDESCSYLVPFDRVAIGKGAFPYAPDDVWAEPNLDAAAEILQRIAKAPSEAAAIGELARLRTTEFFHPQRASEFLSGRMAEIERRRSGGYVSTAGDAARSLV